MPRQGPAQQPRQWKKREKKKKNLRNHLHLTLHNKTATYMTPVHPTNQHRVAKSDLRTVVRLLSSVCIFFLSFLSGDYCFLLHLLITPDWDCLAHTNGAALRLVLSLTESDGWFGCWCMRGRLEQTLSSLFISSSIWVVRYQVVSLSNCS